MKRTVFGPDDVERELALGKLWLAAVICFMPFALGLVLTTLIYLFSHEKTVFGFSFGFLSFSAVMTLSVLTVIWRVDRLKAIGVFAFYVLLFGTLFYFLNPAVCFYLTHEPAFLKALHWHNG